MSAFLLHLALSAAVATALPMPIATPLLHRVTADSVQGARTATMVEVDNRNFNDATVYLVQGLRSVRLGVVNGLSMGTFVIPDDVARSAIPVRFAIRPFASRRRTVSEQISVYRGDTIGLLIPPF